MSELRDILEELGSVVIAYSGGVDSTYLAWAAHRALAERALAVTADSASMPRDELDETVRIARDAGFAHEVVRTDEFEREDYLRNAPDRCFHCKEALFDRLFPLAAERGYAHVALGTVTDDLGDVRPGLESARRRGARQPLLEANLGKADVRALARAAGLPVWDKPAAACLSSRIPHGMRVTTDALARVERAEAAVRAQGFRVVRVRHLGDRARVEVGGDELAQLLAEPARTDVIEAVMREGYVDVVIDERGYRQGGARLPIVQGVRGSSRPKAGDPPR